MLWKYLNKYLSKGFIRVSLLPIAVLIIFIKKSGGKLCVTDLIYRTVQVLRENLYWIKISAQNVGLMEPVKP